MNYQKELERALVSLQSSVNTKGAKNPTLLLHACCAPCSSYVLEYLLKYFCITIYYYNPNIYPKAEYERRLNELRSFLSRFPLAIESKTPLIVEAYNPLEYFCATKADKEVSLQTEKEKGERCARCYRFRLEKSFMYAATYNFDWCTTTLSISPFKDANKINEIGSSIEENMKKKGYCTKFLPGDFKKRNGFKRSLEISKQYGLYRQQYCGCLYSFRMSKSYTGQAENERTK